MYRFQFFEKAKIISTSGTAREYLVGKIGMVVGMTPIREYENGEPDFSEVINYCLAIDGEEKITIFFPDEIEPTGEFGKRDDYYSGTSIRVGVDNKGRGFLLEEPVNTEEKK